MRKRSFLTLAGITALAVAAAIVTQPSNHLAKIAGSGEIVAPDLVKSINDVHGITIVRKKDTLTITRGKDKCIDGTVTIGRAGNNLVWGWIGAFRGKAYVAWGTLTRN